MRRALDFIVFGVPRSGTKALARAVSLHPHVYCALERFSYRHNHAEVVFPDSFTTTEDVWDPQDLSKIKRIRADIRAKRELRHIGNKQPRYYFDLERVNRELPGLKNLWIYRSPYGFIQSWDRQAADEGKARWHPGQVGLFGVLELLCCVDSCSRLTEDVFVFPYERGLNESSEPVLETLAYLGADEDLFDLERFLRKYLPSARNRIRSPPKPYEQELIDTLRTGELDQILAACCGVLTTREKRELGDYLSGIAAVLPQAVDEAFHARKDDAEVVAFGALYFHRYRVEMNVVLRMLQGSKTMARFADSDYGPVFA